MKFRQFVVLLVLGVLVLSACTPQTIEVTREVEVEVTKEVVVEVDTSPLTITIPWTGDAMELFMPVVAGFEEETGIQVKVLPYKTEDLGPLLPAQFMAEEPMADLFIMSWPWWIEENAENLVDVTDVTDGIDFLANTVEVDGMVYGVPSYLFVKPGFWYRQSFFEANGLAQPATWDEFSTLLEATKGIDGIEAPMTSPSGYPLADIVENFLGTFGGPELVNGLIDGSIAWTDPQVVAIFSDYLIPLLENGDFSTPVDRHAATDLWWEGDYALHFYGNWVSESVEDPTDLGILTLPGATTVVGGSDWMFIPKYTNRVDDAKAFMAYVISDAGMNLRLANGGRLSSRADYPVGLYPTAEATLAEAISTFTVLPDLDDTIGGEWQELFWDQMALVWVEPSAYMDALDILQENMPE